MGYLQMQLINETTEKNTKSICLNINRFLPIWNLWQTAILKSVTNILLSVSMRK